LDKHLRIYLNDHLAGSTVGQELAKRSLRNNRGSAVGDYLETFVVEVQQDRAKLVEIMRQLGARPNPGKVVTAWTSEKVARLKPNGRIRGYSGLSRLVELESLCLGVEGKLCGWRALKSSDQHSRLRGIDLDELIERAESQRSELERHRIEAASRSLRA
jgi:hypothetical protein